MTKCRNMKDELNCSYNGGGVAYLLQSVTAGILSPFETLRSLLLPKKSYKNN